MRARSAGRKASPPKPEDLREHRRYAVTATSLRVTWLNSNGDLKVENGAQPIDVSETGMAAQLPEPALLLSRIRLESDQGEFLGHGKVRSCRAAGEKYIVGIEFTDSLRWSAPEGPVNEPIPLSAPMDEEESTSYNESDASPTAATEVPETLLWSETLDGRTPATRPEGIQSADKVESAKAGLASTGASLQPLPELHLSLDSIADRGFLARLPAAVKASALVVVALTLSSLFFAHGGTMSDSSAGNAITSDVGEQGWVTEWVSDAGGSRRGRQITVYRPSANLSDYQMQFVGQIESKALGWVVRAADTKNYYGMKIENDQPGSVKYTRFAIVGGRQSTGTEKRLPIQARADTAYNVRVEASGPRFSVYIQDEPVDLWTDDRLKTGALGFMNQAEEHGRTNSVRFSFPDTIGR